MNFNDPLTLVLIGGAVVGILYWFSQQKGGATKQATAPAPQPAVQKVQPLTVSDDLKKLLLAELTKPTVAPQMEPIKMSVPMNLTIQAHAQMQQPVA